MDDMTSGTGNGSPDRGLEYRVARLEDDMRDVKAILRSIESRLTSIEISVAEIKGKLAGLEARVAALPTVWTILMITFTTWAIGSGILIVAINTLRQ